MRHKNQMIDMSSDNQIEWLRYSAAYPTGAERFTLLRVEGARIISRVASFAETMAAEAL